MEKRVGDLTSEEMKKICDEYRSNRIYCANCPLCVGIGDDDMVTCLYMDDFDLNKKVEV